jgi:hypothetical protein
MRFRCAALLWAACLLATPLFPQTDSTGSLTVTVTDTSHAVVPNAMLTIKNESTGVSRTATSGANGSYTFSLLDPGKYSVNITSPGFKAMNVQSVQIDVTETHVLNEMLELGATEQQVTVSATAQTVDTESSTLGGVVGGTQVTDLPLATRNYTQILGLSPGVTVDVYNSTNLGRGSQFIYVNGSDDIGNNYLEDGVQVTPYGSKSTQDALSFWGSIPIPSPDAVQEFKVQTSLFDATYGHGAGGNIDVVTKTGTNAIHGSAFEFFRNDALNANTFFGNDLAVPRGKLEQNQYGGTLGAPLIKNKLFVFGSYQGTHQINGVAAAGSATVVLPVQLTNNRTAAALGAEFCGVPTYNPTGALNPPSDQVACDGSNINPVALAILNAHTQYGTLYIPSPTKIVGNTGLAGFSIPARFIENQYLGNIDWDLSPRNTVAMRYYYDFSPQSQAFANGAQPPGGGLLTESGNQMESVKLTSIVTNNFVNEARFSDYYIRSHLVSTDIVTAAEVGSENPGPFPAVPVLTFNSLNGTTIGGSNSQQARVPQWYEEWGDQISWSKGKHSIRAGYDQQWIDTHFANESYSRGTLIFQTFPDFLLGLSAAQNGTTLSNIFQTSAQIQAPGGTRLDDRENNLGFYVQDDWKVFRRLTINMGIRWDYFGGVTEENFKVTGATNPVYALDQSVPIPPTGGTYVGYTVAQGDNSLLPVGVVRRNTNLQTNGLSPMSDFGPRLGFAYQPLRNGKVVVRGGYGIFQNQIKGNVYNLELNANPPASGPVNYTGTANALATLADPTNPVPQPGWTGFLRTTTSSLTQSGLEPNLLNPYLEVYNANVQYELAPSWIVQVGYSGSHYIHQAGSEDFNIPTLATPTTPVNCGYDGIAGDCITTNTSQNAAKRVPVLGLGAGKFGAAGNFETARYNSFQVLLKKNFSHGLLFQASYTYAAESTNESGVSASNGLGGNVNINFPGTVFGPADFLRPQRLIINYIYNLPNYRKNQGLIGRALSGWAVSGITTAQAGEGVTFTDSVGGQAYGSFDTSTAELCPGANYGELATAGSTLSRINNYFNSAGVWCAPPIVGAFSSPVASPGATGFGNSGRNVVWGPGQFNWDIAAVKDTVTGGLSENAHLEFRAEFFNAFNHANFSNPGSGLSDGKPLASYGVISSTTNGPRVVQFALKYEF